MSAAGKMNLWDAWDRAMGAVACKPSAEEPAKQCNFEFPEEPSSGQVEDRETNSDPRRRRRSRIPSNAEIVRWNCVHVKPEVAKLVDASSTGILFITDREYPVGEELLVRFPFPSSTSPKQKGTVVRVEELPDGRRQVAVRLD